MKAPVGRWQKGKDLQWYNKDRDKKHKSKLSSTERDAIRQAEDDAMNAALGHKPIQKEQQAMNKEDLTEALKRNQGERDSLEIEHVEGVGLSSVRSSMLNAASTKQMGVDFMIPVGRKKSGSTDKKGDEDNVKDDEDDDDDDGKRIPMQESPESDIKKKKHKKKDKKHKKKKKKKKKLMKLDAVDEKNERKHKKKLLAEPELTGKKKRHDSDSDSDDGKVMKESVSAITAREPMETDKKTIQQFVSKQDKDSGKHKYEERDFRSNQLDIEKIKNKKYRNQSDSDNEVQKKMIVSDSSSSDSECDQKTMINKHSLSPKSSRHGEIIKNIKHKEASVEKQTHDSDKLCQKYYQENPYKAYKGDKYRKLDRDTERIKERFETGAKPVKERSMINSPPSKHTVEDTLESHQFIHSQKSEKSCHSSKINEYEKKSYESNIQRSKDNERNKKSDSENHGGRNRQFEYENYPGKSSEGVLPKHISKSNRPSSQSSGTHSEKYENKRRHDSSSSSENDQLEQKHDDKSYSKPLQGKRATNEIVDSRSKISNKTKSSSDELLEEHKIEKGKSTIMRGYNENMPEHMMESKKTIVRSDGKNVMKSSDSSSSSENEPIKNTENKIPVEKSGRSSDKHLNLEEREKRPSNKLYDSSSASEEEQQKICRPKRAERKSNSSSSQENSDIEKFTKNQSEVKPVKKLEQKQINSSDEDNRPSPGKSLSESSKKLKPKIETKRSSSSSSSSSSSDDDIKTKPTDKKSSKRDRSSDSDSSRSEPRNRYDSSHHKNFHSGRHDTDRNRRSPSSSGSDKRSPQRNRYGDKNRRRDSSSDSEPRQSTSRNWDDRRPWIRRQPWSRNWRDNRGYRWQPQRYQRNFGRRQMQSRWQNNRNNMDRQGYRGSYNRNVRDRYMDSNRRRRDSSSDSSGRGRRDKGDRDRYRRSERGPSSSRRRSNSSSSDSDEHSKHAIVDSRGKGEKRNYRKRHDSSSDSEPRKKSRNTKEKSTNQKRRYSSDSS